MKNFETQNPHDDSAENLKPTTRGRLKALLSGARRLPEYWEARRQKRGGRHGIYQSKDTLAEKEGFEVIEGYGIEVFSSEQEMYSFMEEIRKYNTLEAHGFVVKKSKLGFYYQMGTSHISVEIPAGLENSWHSHPDSNISEAVFNENNLSDAVSEEIKELSRKVFEGYGNVDQVSPNKVSLMDIINIVQHGRKEDLISMPEGHLLSLRFSDSQEDALCRKYASRIDEYWKDLIAETRPKVTKENTNESKLAMILRYYDYAISQFKAMIVSLGYEKMTTENFLEILDKLGLPHNFQKI